MTSQELEQIREDIAEIKRAVVGSTTWGQKGLLKRVEEIESFVRDMKIKIAFYSGVGTVLVLTLKYGAEYVLGKH